MSVDVSPDGQTIVFDLLGDLYTLSIAGGRALRLTSGGAFDAQPRFSPDGRHIAFVSDRNGVPNLWIMDRDGRNAQRISALRNVLFGSTVTSPAWSVDGRSIVVAQRIAAGESTFTTNIAGMLHERRWSLAAYDVTSRTMRWIMDTASERAQRALGPAFSPDGATLYASVEPHRTAVTDVNSWRIARVDMETGSVGGEMATSIGRDGLRPAVSPDGRFLVYVSGSGTGYGFRLRDRRTLRERWLVQEGVEVIGSPEGRATSLDLVPGYAFTPDSRSLVAAFGGKIHRIDLLSGRVSVILFSADVEQVLAPMALHSFSLPDGPFRTRGIMQPAISPDGQAVVFSALDRLWVMELPSNDRVAGTPRRLTADSLGEFYPSWSPDGQWVAYSTWDDVEGGAVRRVQVHRIREGTPAVSVRLTTEPGLYFHTAVSPDGQHVLAVRSPLTRGHAPSHTVVSGPLRSVALVWLSPHGGPPMAETSLASQEVVQTPRLPLDQVYFTDDPRRVHIGLTSVTMGRSTSTETLVISDPETSVRMGSDIGGVLAPHGGRALITYRRALFEVAVPTPVQGKNGTVRSDTLRIEEAKSRPFGARDGAARRWGRALAPWISWSLDGRRVLFNQGGTLIVGDVVDRSWTRFTRVDVPLLATPDVPRGTLVLRGARLVTMAGSAGAASPTGAGVIERGDIVIRDNRIVAVGTQGAVPVPVEAQILDVSGKTILPGYVDIHDHLAVNYGVTSAQCWQCFVRLASGVTTSRSASASERTYSDHFTLMDQERAGQIVSPRILSTGIPNYRSDRPVQTIADACAVIEPLVDYFASGALKEYDANATRSARQLVAQAAGKAGLNATIHGEGLYHALTALQDGFTGLEHAITIPLHQDVLALIARSGVTHTQTYGVSFESWNYWLQLPLMQRQLQRLSRFVPPSARDVWLQTRVISQRASPEPTRLRELVAAAAGITARGGRVGIGSHGDVGGLSFHGEMWLHALGGMPNIEILRSATTVGAAAIGYDRDLGSLEAGKLADLQILDRNPLDDIHHTLSIRYVMKNGRLYQVDDLTEIWPHRRTIATGYPDGDSRIPPTARR